MATYFCKKPCDRHKFPKIRSKEDALKIAEALEFKKENPDALVLVNIREWK